MDFPYQRLRELRKDIIYISLSGFGQEGRDSKHTTWGPTAQGISGLTAMSGLPGHPPAGWGYSYLDHTAGFYAAIAALLALWHRRQTGRGQEVDMSQVETGILLTGVQLLKFQLNDETYAPFGNQSRNPAVAPHAIYPARDEDTWVAIAAETDDRWHLFCRVLGIESLVDDLRFATNEARVTNHEALDALIAEVTAQLEAHELVELLQGHGITAGVCQAIEDRMERDAQLDARGFYPVADHAELGPHRFEGFPMHFSSAAWAIERGAPLVGEHNDEILTALLGYSLEDIERLRSEAAI